MTDEDAPPEPRQRVERARGARRARLTPAPGSDPSPETAVPGGADDDERPAARGAGGADDERLRREKPPHW